MAGMSQEQGTALGDDCLSRFSSWVETEWQTQPSSLEAIERHFERYRKVVVACIRENGGTVKDDVTRTDAMFAAISVQDATGVDCFDKAGISL